MSTVENSNFEFHISIIYEVVLSKEINHRQPSEEDLEIIISTFLYPLRPQLCSKWMKFKTLYNK